MMFQMRTYQELDIPKHQNQEIGLYHASLIHMYSIYIYTLWISGKLLHNYGKSPCYQWVNPLFRLGHFPVRISAAFSGPKVF
jgi:hypothetical protein